MKVRHLHIFGLFSLILFFISCSEDNTIEISDLENNNDRVANSTLDTQIKDFIWRVMNTCYLWQQDVPDLNDNKNTENGYVDFLVSENTTPTQFFYSKMLYQYGSVDKFSYITDNYIDLENSLSGISKDNGMHFILKRQEADSSDLFGVVTYVAKNSDAEKNNVKRGDIFLSIDGINLNTSNYSDLLYGSNSTYEIALADYDGVSFTPNGVTKSLTKVENFFEDPIHKNIIIEKLGKKIAYLMYTRFLTNSSDALNETFKTFKSNGVTDLVLDLRYNPGGSVRNATELASMISGQLKDRLLIKYIYNDKIQKEFENGNKEGLETNFPSELSNNSAIDGLSLTKIYILTSSRSASASELIINGLNPYIDVVQIGDNTVGKYTGSQLFYDSSNFTSKNVNDKHSYAVLPLIVKIANSNGVSDFYDGLEPRIKLQENLFDLGQLGDEQEPLLAKAIEQITGESVLAYTRKRKVLDLTGEEVYNSLEKNPFSQILLLDTPKVQLK